MKKVNYVLLAIVFPLVVSCGSEETAEKKVDLTEEGFDLQGAIELFEKSKSPEDFERALNAESNPVNNLDLNDDGKIDFVKVIDRMKDKSHSITLQVVLNEKENQDIAAIVTEKTGTSSARAQIIGNEVLYGKEVVLEPIDKSGDSEPKAAMMIASNAVVTVNVWTWPIIQHVYRVEYVPYVSPVKWEVYPVWYKPHRHHHKHHGKGHAYGHYKHHHDDGHYRVVPVSDLVVAREIYISNRTNSATISIQFRRDFPNFRLEDGRYHDDHYDKHHDKHFDKHHDDHPGNANGHDKNWDRGNEGEKHEKGNPHDGFKGGDKHDGDKHDKGPKHEMKFESPNKSHEKGGDHGNGGGKSDHGNGGGKSDKGGNGGGPRKGGGKKK